MGLVNEDYGRGHQIRLFKQRELRSILEVSPYLLPPRLLNTLYIAGETSGQVVPGERAREGKTCFSMSGLLVMGVRLQLVCGTVGICVSADISTDLSKHGFVGYRL